ncbi:MAG: hypothetical protein ACD_58C00033G0003, partial [uncultured bacterium]
MLFKFYRITIFVITICHAMIAHASQTIPYDLPIGWTGNLNLTSASTFCSNGIPANYIGLNPPSYCYTWNYVDGALNINNATIPSDAAIELYTLFCGDTISDSCNNNLLDDQGNCIYVNIEAAPTFTTFTPTTVNIYTPVPINLSWSSGLLISNNLGILVKDEYGSLEPSISFQDINISGNTLTGNMTVGSNTTLGTKTIYYQYQPNTEVSSNQSFQVTTVDPISLGNITTTLPVEANFSTTFNISISGGTGIYTYNWDFNDGGSSTNQTPTHTYASTGPYTVSANITDSIGNYANTSTLITVIAPVSASN